MTADRRASRAPWLAGALIALLAIAIAWAYAATTLQVNRRLGLPLDDSYIYLTYAKQFGRGEPFSYYPGGGYSAGSTSVLWPMLLAPFWTLGARGHALVWVSFLACAALYVATCLGVWRVARRYAGDLAATLAAIVLLAIAPFAWTSLSGMEVAFAAALLVATILLLLDQDPTAAPGRRLALCLAAASLSRPEATLIVIGIVGVAVLGRLRARAYRAAAWWLLPLAAPAAWLLANKLFAGQLFPNTGVAKSHFYLPGFDWSYWASTVVTTSGRMLRGLCWDATSPLPWPRAFAVAWLVGAARVLVWAWRADRRLVGALIVGAPLALVFAVVASSGLWSFQNYRYIGPAFPLLALPIAAALAVPARLVHPRARLAWRAGSLVAVALVVRAGFAPLRADARLFAQGAMDTESQVVAIGRYLHAKLPAASVMFHDAGAIAYYGDGRVYDMLGLVTNHQAGIANHGAGSRFEFLEALPVAQRPTHFAYYPSWLGTNEFFGEVLLETRLRPGIEKRRLVGDANMQVITAVWDHVGTGERPLTAHPGWHVVDRVDVADLASERAHGWRGAIGRRAQGDPTARWSLVGREVGERGLVLDGGRTIRGRRETFSLALDPARPTRLLLRTGGAASVPWHEDLRTPVAIAVQAGGREVGRATIPAPTGRFVELAFELPAGVSVVTADADGAYRSFHWFALQPD